MGDKDASRPLGRRTVLLSTAGIVIGAVTTRVVPHSAATERLAAPPGAVEAAAHVSRTAVSTTIPPWARRWHAPIYDLDDFLRRDRHAHFPRRSVLLTVDDGPSPIWTPRYLRLFEHHDVKATFNMIGAQVRGNASIVKSIVAEGHAVSNHTWTHDEQLPSRSMADIRREIVRTNEAIHDVSGVHPHQFRAPGGVWGPRVFAELARQQMMPLGWDIDPRDWARPGTPAIESAMLRARRGDIILCHDGGGDRSETYRALRTVVPELKRRGFTFVTLP